MRCYERHQAHVHAAWARVERKLDALPDPLVTLARDWLARIGPDHRAYFSSRDAPPLLYLPLWLAEGVGADLDEEALATVLELAIWGYFAIRLQDDVLDDPRSDAANTLLANLCLLELERGSRRWLVEPSGLLDELERAWLDFNRWTLAEHLQLRSNEPYSQERFEQHCDKVAFARVPLLLVGALRGREIAAPVRALVHALGVSYGLTNDLQGLQRDLQSGQRTYLLARAGYRLGAGQALAELEVALYDEGLVRQTVAESLAWLERAEGLADALELLPFRAFADERRATLEQISARAHMTQLERALRGAPS